EYVRTHRVGGLRLSPDGSRLVAPVSGLSPDGKSFRSAVWEIDTVPESEGGRSPRRLTRSPKSESSTEFLPDGSLLFGSTRTDPEAEPDAKPETALSLLPAEGGEARQVASRPGGISSFGVARNTALVTFTANAHPGAQGTDAEREARKE